MKITIYSVCWNEEVLLPFFFKHYKSKFPQAKFIIYDNESDDQSRDIIKLNGGEIRDFKSKGEVRDDFLLDVKNHAWKNLTSEWVIICDIDEFMEADETYLSETNATIIRCEGYEMVGDSLKLETIKKGTRNYWLDKCLAFKPAKIKEINYTTGCHSCNPTGVVIYNKERILLKHYKYFKLSFVINRFEILGKRLSKKNKDNNWSLHYLQNEKEIETSYLFLLNNSKLVPLPFFLYLYYILNSNKVYSRLTKFVKMKRPFVSR
jgi:hypothetical protein